MPERHAERSVFSSKHRDCFDHIQNKNNFERNSRDLNATVPFYYSGYTQLTVLYFFPCLNKLILGSH